MSETSKFKKSPRKIKQSLTLLIEKGIPEAPRLSDFISDYPERLDVDSEQESLSCNNALSKKDDNFFLENKEKEQRRNVDIISPPDVSLNIKTPLDADESYENAVKPIISKNTEMSSSNCKYPSLSSIMESMNINIEASAPTDSNYDFKNKLEDNHYVLENGREVIDLNKYNFDLKIEDSLPPFTDEMLAKFYYNFELERSIKYLKEFNSSKTNKFLKSDNYFFKLLIEYAQAKSNLIKSKCKIETLKNKIDTCKSTMWAVYDDIKINKKETCKDGNLLTFEYEYVQAQFNNNAYNEFVCLLKEFKSLIFEAHVLDSFVCSFLKYKIEYYIQCILESCPQFTNLDLESSISKTSSDTYTQKCFTTLKDAISVLFDIQRDPSFIHFNDFIEETRQWLSDLTSVLIRIGDWKDHIFILGHVMRCPSGMGEWAACFIQLPCSISSTDPFSNSQINHIMTIINIFLNPIFEEEKSNKEESEINPWIIVDSDGEVEDESSHKFLLRENDLVSILNQIPFSYLFKNIFFFYGCENTYTLSSEYLLKLFAFSTDFIKIFLCGLKLYSRQKYKQFTKRLGRLICHIVCYITEAFIIYKTQKPETNEVERIQAEYDNFFLRSFKFIYSTKKLGTWQFLVAMPYSMVSRQTTLKLYSLLQLNDQLDNSTLKIHFENFEEKFILLPEEEQCYLLTTIANMALARDVSEILFIKSVLLQLFFIGFISSQAIDKSYKNVEHLLSCLCSSHPFLISEILKIQNCIFMSNPDYNEWRIMHLWAKLPLKIWIPNKIDLEIIKEWVLEPFQSLRYELGRIICMSLNYGLCEGALFLPEEIHHTIAFILIEANNKLCNENEPGFLKNVSNLVCTSTEQIAHNWIWSILLKLRLHLMDKTEALLYKYFNHLEEYLRVIPDVESNSDLNHFVIKKQPLSCFVALMTTSLGHSVPVICDKGFDLVEVLFGEGKYTHGIACLEFIIFLFLDCSNSLYECDKFISLLTNLVNADNTLTQRAKNLISSNFPGPVLRSVESMMQSQLSSCRTIHFSKFSKCVQLWLLSLTKIPQWTQEHGVKYLLDKLLQNVFFDYSTTKIVTNILDTLLNESKSPSETKSSFLSLIGWINLKFITPTLFPIGFNDNVPWLSYLTIQIQFENCEKKNSLWLELIRELNLKNEKKVDIDNSLKKVCNFLGLPVRPSNTLAIYKWSNQIINTDISHPLTPLLWQKFFYLYFFRVPGQIDCGSAGEKFFGGVHNQRLLDQLKKQLEETFNYFKAKMKDSESSRENECLKFCNLFQSYSFWINDSNLHRAYLNVLTLSKDYSPELLGLLIHGSDAPWIDFIDYYSIENDLKTCTNYWSNSKKRGEIEKLNKLVFYQQGKTNKDSIEKRLNSYETPLPPPRVDFKKYSFNRITMNILINSEDMMAFVRPLAQKLFKFKELHNSVVDEYLALEFSMQELPPHLYFMSNTEIMLSNHCDGVNKTVNGKVVHYNCTGPAIASLIFEESKINEKIFEQFNQCTKSFHDSLPKFLSLLPSYVSVCAVSIDIAIEELQKEFNLASSKKDMNALVSQLSQTGVKIFYELVHVWSSNFTEKPPLMQAFERYIDVLGKTFVENNAVENSRLLALILNTEMLGEKLIKYFNPNVSSPHQFVSLYSIILSSDYSKRYNILLKFDLNSFLNEQKPKFSVRSQLITVIEQGLIAASRELSENRLLIKLLNENLETLLKYDFPEHYGEVLNFLLQASRNQSISKSTWYAFLNSIINDGNLVFNNSVLLQTYSETKFLTKHLKHYFIQCAGDQKIPLHVVKGTINLLVSNFKNERIKSGVYGLYRKYHEYLEPLFVFFGMLSYSCVAKTVEADKGSLSEKLTQKLWPLLSDLYSPWLIPYRETSGSREQKTVFEHGAHDDTFDNTIFLPWTLNESRQATFCSSVFAESVRFVLETLPGFNNILRYVWHYYVSNFSCGYVKDYIMNVINESLMSLPWETFCPNLQDVELMLKVVNQPFPMSQNFVGYIFFSVKWSDLMQHYLSSQDNETTTKLHICFLNLILKLSVKLSGVHDEKILFLLEEANSFAWHLIDSRNYEVALNWFTKSCDPRIILIDDELEQYKINFTILRLLQTCAGYVSSIKTFHYTTVSKRLMFVRACVKLLIISNQRFPSKDTQLFKKALCKIWNNMNSVILETTPATHRIDEVTMLLGEFLIIFLEPELSTFVGETLKEWLFNHKSHVMIFGILRSAGNVLETPEVYGNVIEFTLDSYFNFIGNCDWSEIMNVLTPFSKTNTYIEKVFFDNKCFLILYATLLRKFSENQEKNFLKLTLTDLLHFLSEVKLSSSLEPKVLLLLIFSLKLIKLEISQNEKEGISYLNRLICILNNFVEDKGAGFFSAIGLKKPSFSNRFKLISLSTCCCITVYLKKNYSKYQDTIDGKVLEILESAENNKLYQDINQYVSCAKTLVKEITTIDEIISYVRDLGFKLFNAIYLK